ncbi:hypothetical protein DXG01_014033 [Tephrocybe rancida]|nr:hypothetical protein DXG01_014033 [Tephrocybe rancida]
MDSLINDALSVTGPLTEVDGLTVVALFNPIALGLISALQALQDRKAAIAAVPPLGPFNALATINTIVGLETNTTLTLKATFAQSVFTVSVVFGPQLQL